MCQPVYRPCTYVCAYVHDTKCTPCNTYRYHRYDVPHLTAHVHMYAHVHVHVYVYIRACTRKYVRNNVHTAPSMCTAIVSEYFKYGQSLALFIRQIADDRPLQSTLQCSQELQTSIC